MKYHALFVMFEKEANFEIVVCCKLMVALSGLIKVAKSQELVLTWYILGMYGFLFGNIESRPENKQNLFYYTSRKFPIQNFHRQTTDILDYQCHPFAIPMGDSAKYQSFSTVT